MGIVKKIRKWRFYSTPVVSYQGLNIKVTVPQISREILTHIYHNMYEVHEIKGLRAIIHPFDHILEIGTGLGIITALAARQAKDGKVLSFEANPKLIAGAHDVLERNAISNVEIRHGILAKDPQNSSEIFHIAESFAESSLRPMSGAMDSIDVPTHDLDEVIASFRPDVLICDIEGAEADLLPQFKLDKLRAAVVELHPNTITDVEVARIYDHFLASGLYPKIEHSGGTVVVFERLK